MIDLVSLLTIFVAISCSSYVFFDNPVFVMMAAAVTGAYAGHFISTNFTTLGNVSFTPLLAGNLFYIIPCILVVLLFTTWSDRYRWLARYPTAILTGTGLGVALRALISAQFLDQLEMTLLPIVGVPGDLAFANIVFIVVFILTVYYFIFGWELKGPWLTLNKVARMAIMGAMGVQATGLFWIFCGRIATYMTMINWLTG